MPLVAVCTRLLNEARIPFELKVVDDPGSFPRCDAAVLYLDDGRFERARDSLRTIVSRCGRTCTANRRRSRSRSRPGWPSASMRAASAGASGRAAVAWSPRASSPRTRAARPGSRIGSTPSPAASRSTGSTSRPRIWRRDRRSLCALTTFARGGRRAGTQAREIGDLARRSLQLGRGASPGRLPRRSATAALGADLYGGTGGVALFLAEAGSRLDDDRLRTTALGAIRHALDHAGRIHPELRDGLYHGPIGVVYAATRAAALLDSEELIERARDLLRVASDGTRSASTDVMSGCAGAWRALSPLAPVGRAVAGRCGCLTGGRADREGGAQSGGVVLGVARTALDAQPLRLLARRRRHRARARRALRRDRRRPVQGCRRARIRPRALVVRPADRDLARSPRRRPARPPRRSVAHRGLVVQRRSRNRAVAPARSGIARVGGSHRDAASRLQRASGMSSGC